MRAAARASAPRARGRPRRATATPPIVTSMRSASMGTPAVPAAETKRPQLGSPPWNAHRQSVEVAIARAMRRASAAPRAPRTTISTSRVAPSPSSTTRRAISPSASARARASWRSPREPGRIVGFAAAPLARRSTVSLVLVSPSTEIALSDPATAARKAARAAGRAIAASVTAKTSSVAMAGAIMPAPLPRTATVTGRPPSVSRRTAVFGNASVVQIACAAAGSASGARAATARRTPASSGARGTGTPMRPVAQASTASGGTPSSRAASAVDTSTVRSPSGPVQALALPACTRTAAARPARRRRRETATGAATTRFCVNTPAATTGRSAAISATSSPRALRPARTPAKRNPATATRCARRASFIRPGSRGAVALLVLLAAAAGTRGVATHLGPVAAHGLDLRPPLFGRSGVREADARRLRPALALLEVGHRRRHRRAVGRSLGREPHGRALHLDLHAHRLLDDVGLEAPHHLFEDLEAFLLVLLERVELPVAAQPDALLQVLHRQQVLPPERVERLEHDEPLEMAQHVRAVLPLARGVSLPHALDEELLEPLGTQARALGLGQCQAEIELGEDRVVDRLPVPLLRRRVGVGMRRDQVRGQPLGHLEHVLAQVLAREDVAAARVDHLALLVEDVVVLEEVLADVEVVRLDLFLGVADGARDEAVLDRHALLHAEALHEPLHAVGTEDAQEIVLEGEKEARRAGVALAAAAAAELVVDAAGFVALGTDDVEPAGRDHLLALGRADAAVLLDELLEPRLVLLRRLLQLLADLLDLLDVAPPRLLVAPLGLRERRLGGPVRRAPLAELAVDGPGPVDEERELEEPCPALVLRPPVVERAGDLVGALLLPGRERRVVALAQRRELRPPLRERTARRVHHERRLELLLRASVPLRDRVALAHGRNQVHGARLLVALAQRPQRRELPEPPLGLGKSLERLGPLLLERLERARVPLSQPRHLLLVALAQRPERVLVALLLARPLGPADRAANPLVLHLGASEELRVPAEQNVGAAPGHVGRDRHLPEAPSLRDDVRLGFVVDGVQHVVLDARLLEELRDPLRLLHRGRADQHGLPARVARLDLFHHGVELLPLALVDDVRVVRAPHGLVRRDHDHVELVDVLELDGLGVRGPGHPRELLVHAEVVLDRDRREREVLALDLHALLRLDRLVQPVRPAPARHEPARELVDDDDLAVLHDVVDVALEDRVRLERLGDVVERVDLARIVEVRDAEQALALGNALLRERGAAVLLVDRVVDVAPEPGDDAVDRVVLLARLLGRARDDERRARLVDEDVVHFVDDRVVELALDVLVQAELHVVAQVVEAELVVGPVGDVAAVGVAPLDGPQVQKAVVLRDVGGIEAEARVVDDRAHAEPEVVVDGPHPLHVAPGEVVVDRDEVRAPARERVQVKREGRHQRLALAGLHLGDLALVEHDAADHLHVVVAKPDRPPRRLAHRGKRVRQEVVEGLARGEPLPERGRPLRERLGRQRRVLGLERGDLLDDRPDALERALVGAAEEAREKARHREQGIVAAASGPVKPSRASALDAHRRVDARAEEARAHADEALGRVGDEEAGAARPRRAGHPVLGELCGDLPGGLLGRVHERHAVAHHRGDDRPQQRVVRAAENEGVDAAVAEAREVGFGHGPRHRALRPAFLGEGDEERAGARVDLEIGDERAQRLRVRPRGDRRLGGDHADATAPRARHRRPRSGLDDAHDRQVVARAQGVEGHRRHRVARDHEHLHVALDEELRVLERVAGDRLGGLGAVGIAARVAEVDDVLARQRAHDRVHDREPAHARVEDPDRPVALPHERTFYSPGAGRSRGPGPVAHHSSTRRQTAARPSPLSAEKPTRGTVGASRASSARSALAAAPRPSLSSLVATTATGRACAARNASSSSSSASRPRRASTTRSTPQSVGRVRR